MPLTGMLQATNEATIREALAHHWPEYLIEAAGSRVLPTGARHPSGRLR